MRVTFLKIYVKFNPPMEKVLVVDFVSLTEKYGPAGPVHPSISNILAILANIMSYLPMKSLLASKV